MDFLNKLYDSNYFGIGLFAVISFLVVTFLIVLFFGKRDEKKRKLEETNNLTINQANNVVNGFQETSVPTPVEVPVQNVEPVPVMPVNPVNEMQSIPVQNVEPVAPINFESEPIKPVMPVNYEEPKIEVMEEKDFVENLVVEEPVKQSFEIPVVNEPVMPMQNSVEPTILEPIKYDIPATPKVMEPVKINIPNEPINVAPIIEEDVKPLITPVSEPIKIVEEPINNSYYQPLKEAETEEISVPNIDFDALAKSISKELDELERSTKTNKYEEVKVTPISEITDTPINQFSSVYVNQPVNGINKSVIDLPKKIDLPIMKSDEIEPENYSL